ncbi:hypothetical protein CHCC14559_1636 [Bacillus licheniformis]|nr:hypothetical protein CHCC14813_2673 [Bacillus licheniformis]TWN02487.1 hypothetical protein CHCC14568_3169 [Bacillus licheniformis]TWN21005.1 hypothetical protein CHCC14562_0165 [Bacillus licheniformis]TWN24128.1 hypothetical protein CHCC14559_1636 [Bacillus licheniformis]TWN53530.1 hypothetical protein CHCC14437_3771 [Bacillus licheniformis]
MIKIFFIFLILLMFQFANTFMIPSFTLKSKAGCTINHFIFSQY